MTKSKFKSSAPSGVKGNSLTLLIVIFVLMGGVFLLSKDPASLIPSVAMAPSEQAAAVPSQEGPGTRDQFFLDSSQTPGFATFHDEQYMFQIDYPEGWDLQTPMFDFVAAMFFAPQEDAAQPFYANVNVTVDDAAKYKEMSLQDYADQALAQLKQVFPNYELLDQGARNLGNVEGHYMVASYMQEDKKVEIFSIFAFAGERIYALTYSYLPEQKELSEPLVDHMVESFSLS